MRHVGDGIAVDARTCFRPRVRISSIVGLFILPSDLWVALRLIQAPPEAGCLDELPQNLLSLTRKRYSPDL